MKSLIADFVQFSCAIAKSLFLNWCLSNIYTLNFEIFLRFPYVL